MKKFALYRILGNDLPPRHSAEQTLDNLRFILEREPVFPDCEKRWVVNRIVDREQESKIMSFLDRHAQKYIHIPFRIEEYAQCRYDIDGLPKELFLHNRNTPALPPALHARLFEYPFRHKNRYAMNNNGARNAALEQGRAMAEWIMPWDGCCFMTGAAWHALLRDMESLCDEKYLIVPMVRVYDNLSLLDAAFAPDPADEPQIAFHREAQERFDAQLRYGYNPKAELLRRLRVPGPWEKWGKVPWEPQGLKDSSEAGKFRHAGWVARLYSGLPRAKDGDAQRHSHRMGGIVSKLSELDERVLRQKFNKDTLLFYDETVLSACKNAWVAGDGHAASLVGNLLHDAAFVLDKGPYSVCDKTAIPPGGNPHDYLSPAAHWWKDEARPGAVSRRHDGERSSEALLYSPESGCYDRTRLQLAIDHTTLLALAWYFTGDNRFAERAALLIRVWFLDTATCMNPHLKYAQIRMGEESEQQGYGIIETRDFYFFLDAVRLVFRTGKISMAEQLQFRQWCRAFLNWLMNSPQGKRMFFAQNNQGTFHDLQVASLAAFLDNAQLLLQVLRVSSMRSTQQFQPDGSQPEELKRSNSLHYSVFNLSGWFNLDRLASLAGMDLWNTHMREGGSPAAGLAWIWSFRYGEWPYPQRDEFDYERLDLLRYLASAMTQDQGRGRNAAMPGAQGIKPVFHPYAGVQPYWPLGMAWRRVQPVAA